MDGRTIAKLVGVATGALALPLSLWLQITERHTARAAADIRPLATPSDLILISSHTKGGAADPAGLMRPFGALATVVWDPAGPAPDLQTFPQRRVFLVGPDLDPSGLGLPPAALHAPHALPERDLLMTHLPEMKISVEQAGATQPCQTRHAGGGWRCGNQPWQYVGPAVVVGGGKMVACLWSHPVHQHLLHLDIPLGQHRQLAGWLQFSDEALRDPEHPPVHVDVSVAGQPVHAADCVNTGSGRCLIDTRLPQEAASFRITLSTPDAARQLVCLGGELRGNP